MVHIGLSSEYSGELPGLSTRLSDAEKLRGLGAQLIVGVAGVNSSLDAHRQLMVEAIQARLPEDVSHIVGPYVLWISGDEKPFTPRGLAIWQLPPANP